MPSVLLTISSCSLSRLQRSATSYLTGSQSMPEDVQWKCKAEFVERTGKRFDLIRFSFLKRTKQLLPNNIT